MSLPPQRMIEPPPTRLMLGKPLNVEDGLEDTMWIGRQGGQRLHATKGCSLMF